MKLYRGFGHPIENGTVENTLRKTGRTPVHTPTELHEAADAWFYAELGVKARSTCVFCSPDIALAYEYTRAKEGAVEAEIIPEGEFALIFSEDVQDFFSDSDDDECDAISIGAWLSQKNYVKVHSLNDIPAGFTGEVMLDCARYTIVKVGQ
ncbi:hypothetical protein [Vreelandella jeotgali]|uniref:hypothetical protein n=1 Tax=Vreelandella jeotgali TaxID=553386 RepID=UPI00034C732B|nr:hypothetical protein [Halomonas jeotgali]